MKRKLNVKKFARFILSVVAITFIVAVTVDVIRFPECYSTTWKYQLKLDIERGDEKAIEYYENTYISNGRELFN